MIRNTRVVHITTIHKRGDSRIFYKECVSLVKRGYEVFLIIADGKGDAELAGVKIIDIGLLNSRIKTLFLSSYRAYKKAKQIDADIYHFHDPDLLWIGKRLKKKDNLVFFDSHEDFPALMLQRDYIPNLIRKPLFKITTLVEKFFTKRITGIVTVTDKIEQKFKNYGIKEIAIIRNYPLISQSDTTRIERENLYPLAVYVGGLTSIRGVKEMIIACAKAGIKLLLVGPFDSEDYLKQMQSLQEWSNVIYMGYIPFAELYEKVYSKATLGLVILHKAPNHTYSIPIKQLEYMQEGLPVISTSEVEFCKEITTKTECGIVVNPLDIEEIKGAIKKIVEDKAIAKQMSLNGEKAIRECYNWALQEDILVSFYERLLKDNKIKE